MVPPTPVSDPADRRARVGLVGLSGYGGAVCHLLQDEAADPRGRTVLGGVFAPDAGHHGPLLASLAAEGTICHDSFGDLLLDDSLDAVWLPVPIHLHREMGAAVLRGGRTLMLEKPVAGRVEDHLALIDEQRRSGSAALVGFQDIYAPSTATLKRRLLAGDFGRPTAAVVRGSWPRPDAYYARNAWAGRLAVGGATVNDSPLANAMAHFANLALFLLGGAPDASACVGDVRAELWRSRPIESFDTCALRVDVCGAADLDLVVLLTHAASESVDPIVEIDTSRGTLRWTFDGRVVFRAGGDEQEVAPPERPRPHMARCLGRVATGQPAAGSSSDLLNALPHTVLVEAAHRAAAVAEAPASRIDAAAVTRAAASRRTLLEDGLDLPAAAAGTFADASRRLLGDRFDELCGPARGGA